MGFQFGIRFEIMHSVDTPEKSFFYRIEITIRTIDHFKDLPCGETQTKILVNGVE